LKQNTGAYLITSPHSNGGWSLSPIGAQENAAWHCTSTRSSKPRVGERIRPEYCLRGAQGLHWPQRVGRPPNNGSSCPSGRPESSAVRGPLESMCLRAPRPGRGRWQKRPWPLIPSRPPQPRLAIGSRGPPDPCQPGAVPAAQDQRDLRPAGATEATSESHRRAGPRRCSRVWI
jgi:hypothetical protein